MTESRLDDGTRAIMLTLTNDETRLVLGSIVSVDPEPQTYKALNEELKEFRDDGRRTTVNTANRIVEGLNELGLVEVKRAGGGVSHEIRATQLGLMAHQGFTALTDLVSGMRREIEIRRIVKGVPDHLLGSVISGLQDRANPKPQL